MAASPLQKVPAWLLRALNLQTLGQNPVWFGDTVVPTVDAGEQYFRDLQETRLIQSVGVWPSCVVSIPSTEQWRVLAVSSSLFLDAADEASDSYLEISYSAATGVPPHLLLASQQFMTGGGNMRIRSCQAQLPLPILAAAGDRLTAHCSFEGSGGFSQPATLNLWLLVQRLRA